MSDSMVPRKPPSKGFAKKKKNIILLSMLAPGAIWLILLRYLPMFGIVIAFQKFTIYTKNPTLLNNIIHSDWVGFKNFGFLFTTSDSWKMIRNTVGYNALWIVLGTVIAVSFAIMLSLLTKKFVAKAYQTLMFFPYFLSWVVASYFLMAFLDPTYGLINHLQKQWGIEATQWYFVSKPWPILLTVAYLWKNIGYSTVLYLAAITGIDTSQYEAASIDGANKKQQIRYITIPHLKTMIIILFIMSVGRIVNSDFGLFYQVPQNNGPLFPATQVLDTYVYRAFMATNNPGMSTAASLLQNVVGFFCVITANSIVRRIDEESSLF
ncbi:ABC transporter permease [Lachnoclostridium phytofermentans]|uniref:Binding-protein-dependent transport systems inner membrane component n=1 Tax=Lachnoclostridium phytofermentans (strain ATCC 700394 / DSM 18823 / ISDg) TaxID=357809 RepID=A9KMH8_LACP7|nr:ABC transporter permease subunit [Lachnoclostridium phytofermentans]ABX42932.1 binding-protein-dependent transport systems inner membrane component [Lachnoclostridium phytofermentans ISDg]